MEYIARRCGLELLICLFGDRRIDELSGRNRADECKVCERTGSLLDPESSLIGRKSSLFAF